MAYSRLSHETQQSYATTMEAHSLQFEPPSKRKLYEVEFESRQKRDKTSGTDFSDGLLNQACSWFLKIDPVRIVSMLA